VRQCELKRFRVVEEGREDTPEVLMLPRELQERLWADIAPTPGEPKGEHVQLNGFEPGHLFPET